MFWHQQIKFAVLLIIQNIDPPSVASSLEKPDSSMKRSIPLRPKESKLG
jgi:hypothetical protein